MMFLSHKLINLWSFGCFIILFSGIQASWHECTTYWNVKRNLNFTHQEINHKLENASKAFYNPRMPKYWKIESEWQARQEGEALLRQLVSCLVNYMQIAFKNSPEMWLTKVLGLLAKSHTIAIFDDIMDALIETYYKSEFTNSTEKDSDGLHKRFGLIPETLPLTDFADDRQWPPYPSYTQIPQTSFNCGDMDYIPGFYADVETDCQVFHACWKNKRESYLCPISTTFDQRTLTCDLWFKSNCKHSPEYYGINEKFHDQYPDYDLILETDATREKLLNPYFDSKRHSYNFLLANNDMKYVPVAYKTTFYPERLFYLDTAKLKEFDGNSLEQLGDLNLSPQQLFALTLKVYDGLEKAEMQSPKTDEDL